MVLALAIAHPDLGPACEVMLGERAAMDLDVAPAAEEASTEDGPAGDAPAGGAPEGAP